MSATLRHTSHKILLIHVHEHFGGGEIHTLNIYKRLITHNYAVDLLVPHNSKIATALTQEKLPFIPSRALSVVKFRPLFKLVLAWELHVLCKKNTYTILHCNVERELWPVKKIAWWHGIISLFTRHLPQPIASRKLRGFTALIGVSQNITNQLSAQNTDAKLGIKKIVYIPPFFDAAKFTKFRPPTLSRYDFFRTHFNITLDSAPLICTIANLYPSHMHKNHPVLFKALSHLIYEKHFPAHLILVGEGPARAEYEAMVRMLKIDHYVHFLGFSNKTPELLFYADIQALPSMNEAFGIVYLEASLMKKPLIGAEGTGADAIIEHGKSGFLFRNNDPHNLAWCLEKLLKDPTRCRAMGEHAYARVHELFMPERSFEKLEALYDALSS